MENNIFNNESVKFIENMGNTNNNIKQQILYNQINKINKQKINNKNYLNNLDNLKTQNNRYISNKDIYNNNDTNNQYYDTIYMKDKNIDNNIDNNKNTRITRINIDSKYRNIEPKNILDNMIYTLKKNPLYFTKNSNIITIYHENHIYNIGDKIIIQNIKPNKIYLKPNCLEFIQGTTYCRIKHQSHGMNSMTNNYYIKIENIIGITDKSHIGNIPINILNKKHKVYLKRNDNDVFNNNIYYINININIIDNIIYETTIPFSIELMNINGININELNANYPLNSNQLQGFQIITKIFNNAYQFTINSYATDSTYNLLLNNIDYKLIEFNNSLNNLNLPYNNLYNSSGNLCYSGGEGVTVVKIIDVIDGYPDPNYYKISLKRTFYNIKKIRIVSSEFPNTEKVIKSQPLNSKNNMLYWQILQDGDTIYSISLDDGSYTIDTFITELKNKIQSVQRQNLVSNITFTYDTNIVNTYINPYNSVSIDINKATSVFSMTMYNETILEKPFIKSQRIYNDTFNRLTVLHPKHFLNVGDQILISNASSTEGIPASIINGSYIIESIISPDSYEIRLPKYNILSNLDQSYGGTAVSIKLPIDFRLLFDRNGTIGSILGFRNVGFNYAITSYKKTITNQDKYEDDITVNSVGQLNYQKNLINLSGESYILMSCPLFTNSIGTDNAENVFAKIQLAGPPDTILYNQHIQIIEDPIEIIPSLSEIEFKFLTSSGNLFYFNNIEHSFTLELYEEII